MSTATTKPAESGRQSGEASLLNDFQRGLSLSPRPFLEIARQLGWPEAVVLETLRGWIATGRISRVGPVIRPNTVGASTLAAMAVPGHALEEVAALVSRCPEVNHNYERTHRFNLWFVVTAADIHRRDAVIRHIETQAGIPVMALPMLDDYYIDLGFDLNGGCKPRGTAPGDGEFRDGSILEPLDQTVLRAIQDGLPLVPAPYGEIANRVGLRESDVRRRLQRLLDLGIIRRLGVVVRHRECGFLHNAMVVWNVPDDHVARAGRRLSGLAPVRLCYRRPRQPPAWPYNLFCMIHGRDRNQVLSDIDQVTRAAALEPYQRDVLFSTRQFKQRGARYDN